MANLGPLSDTDTARYWAKVDKVSASPCWLWTGATSGGYPNFWFGHRMVPAGQVAWALMHQETPRPVGQQVHTTCGNPRCVMHLRLGRPGPTPKPKAPQVRLVRRRGVGPTMTEVEAFG